MPKGSWADWAVEGEGGAVGGGQPSADGDGVARPRFSRAAMETSARNWWGLATALVILAAIGSAIAGIVFTPETVTGGRFFTETHKDTATGIAIGVSTFVGSLVVVLPYFMLSRLMSGIADLLPSPVGASRTDVAEGGPSEEKLVTEKQSRAVQSPAGVIDFPAVAKQFPSEYEEGRLVLTRLNPEPANPEIWLSELCKRMKAGSPTELAASKIPLDLG